MDLSSYYSNILVRSRSVTSAPYRFPPFFSTTAKKVPRTIQLINSQLWIALSHTQTCIGMNSPVLNMATQYGNLIRLHFMIAFGLAMSGIFKTTLFNILAPSDDSNLNRRLPFPQPTNFPALYLPETHPTTQIRHPLQAGIYALESSLTFSASVGLNR